MRLYRVLLAPLLVVLAATAACTTVDPVPPPVQRRTPAAVLTPQPGSTQLGVAGEELSRAVPAVPTPESPRERVVRRTEHRTAAVRRHPAASAHPAPRALRPKPVPRRPSRTAPVVSGGALCAAGRAYGQIPAGLMGACRRTMGG